MRKSFEVIDDFYQNPTVVRELALRSVRAPGATDGDQNGVWDLTEHAPDDEGVNRMCTILSINPTRAGVTATARFGALVANAPVPEAVGRPGLSWAALVWLTPSQDCRGGFSFRRLRDGAGGGDEETAFVESRFNRAVVFDATTGPHLEGPRLGDDPGSARLARWLHLTVTGEDK